MRYKSLSHWLKKTYNNILSITAKSTNRAIYFQESIKNRYPCKIIGYSYEKGITIVHFCILGKIHNIHQISSKDLLSDGSLLEKFHPKDAAKIGFSIGCDVLLEKSGDVSIYNNTMATMFGEKNAKY